MKTKLKQTRLPTKKYKKSPKKQNLKENFLLKALAIRKHYKKILRKSIKQIYILINTQRNSPENLYPRKAPFLLITFYENTKKNDTDEMKTKSKRRTSSLSQ